MSTETSVAQVNQVGKEFGSQSLLARLECKVHTRLDELQRDRVSHFELTGQPPNLREFLRLFAGVNAGTEEPRKIDPFRFIWVTDCAFLRCNPLLDSSQRDDFSELVPVDDSRGGPLYQNACYSVRIQTKQGNGANENEDSEGIREECWDLLVYASHGSAARIALQFLVALPDVYFHSLAIVAPLSIFGSNKCPLDTLHLRRATSSAHHPQRTISFQNILFNAAETRALLSKANQLVLSDCSLTTTPSMSREALLERTEPLQMLSFRINLPNSAATILDALADQSLPCVVDILRLELVRLAIPTVDIIGKLRVKALLLTNVVFDGPGHVDNFIDSFTSPSPTIQYILCRDDDGNLFRCQNQERQYSLWNRFFRVLLNPHSGSQYQLSYLALRCNLPYAAHGSLCDSLAVNSSLERLSIHDSLLLDSKLWSDLIKVVTNHSTLHWLDITTGASAGDNNQPQTEGSPQMRTMDISDMLSKNAIIRYVDYRSETYDEETWEKTVVPKLHYNIYHRKIQKIGEISNPAVRSAVLSQALASLSAKPWLIMLLLSTNADVIANYLELAPSMANSYYSHVTRKRLRDS